MKQNRAPSPSCASPISGEPTIRIRIGIGVHWRWTVQRKKLNSEGPIIPTQYVTSLVPSHDQQSNPAAHKIQPNQIKHQVIANKENREQKANLDPSISAQPSPSCISSSPNPYHKRESAVTTSNHKGTLIQRTMELLPYKSDIPDPMNPCDRAWETDLVPFAQVPDQIQTCNQLAEADTK